MASVRFLALCLLCVAFAASVDVSAAYACGGSARSGQAAERQVLCLVNAERTKRGLPKLSLSGDLRQAARGHSSHMVGSRFFDHTCPHGSTPSTRARRAGYGSQTIGENLAWGSGSWASARYTVKSWMRSPGHRANILRRSYRRVGVGVKRGAPRGGVSGASTYTAVFGG